MAKRLPRTRTLKGEPKIAYYDSAAAAGTSAGAHAGEPPIVLVHGFTFRSEDWDNVFPRLATRYRVIAYDARGHGKSGRAGAYGLLDYAADLGRVLREVAKEPAIVIGHSLGGQTALIAAAREPRLVRALVLEDPPMSPPDAARRAYFGALLGALAAAGQRAAFASAVARIPLATPGPRGERTVGEMRGFYSVERMTAYFAPLDPGVLSVDEEAAREGRAALLEARPACPTLLLVGDAKAGGMLDDGGVERLQALPDIAVQRFPGIGHRIHGLRPEPFLEALEPFLRKARATPVAT